MRIRLFGRILQALRAFGPLGYKARYRSAPPKGGSAAKAAPFRSACAKLGLALGLLLGLNACLGIEKKGEEFGHLAPGPWRGIFAFGEGERQEDKVPILLQVKAPETAGGLPQIQFADGSATWQADSLRWKWDSLWIYFGAQGKYLRLKHETTLIQGWLEDSRGEDYPVAFYAHSGQNYRFKEVGRNPEGEFSGTWRLSLQEAEQAEGQGLEAELELKPFGDKLWQGSLRLPDAEPLALEGTIQGRQLYFSGFDGRRIAFIKAKLDEQGRLNPIGLRLSWRVYSGEGRK